MKLGGIWLASLALMGGACGLGGGGGGGSGEGASAAPPPDEGGTAPPATSSGFLVLEGPAFVDAGTPYAAQVSFVESESFGFSGNEEISLGIHEGNGEEHEEEIVFVLVQGPPGLSVDPATGAISWLPEESLSGVFTVVIDAVSEEDTITITFELIVQGRKLEGSEFIAASAGGLIAVLDPSSAVYGTLVTIPAGAMAADAEIKIHSLPEPVELPVGALGLDLSPSQTFAAPVGLEVHYTDAWLASLGVADESKLGLFHVDPQTGEWALLADSAPDPANNRIFATASHFSKFAAFVQDPTGLGPVSQQEALDLWELYLGGDPAEAPLTGEILLSMKKNFFQPNALLDLQGGGFDPEETNALLIHGTGSNSANFAALISYAKSRYDNVIFYNYPSGLRIQHNATWLAKQILLDRARFPLGSCMDVFAHSMGGLVARSLIEDPPWKVAKIAAPVHDLFLIGTPNLGAVSTSPGWFTKVATHPGIQDELPGSAFLASLNSPPGQGWAHYHVVYGDVSGLGTDLVVPTASANPSGIFQTSHSDFVAQNHSHLHTKMMSNGVASSFDSWRNPCKVDPAKIHVSGKSVTAVPATDPFGTASGYEEVLVSLTLTVDEGFCLPPWTPITVVWSPFGTFLGCEDLEIDKAILFLDDLLPDINLEVPEILKQDTPEMFARFILDLTAPPQGSWTLTRKEEDLDFCTLIPPGAPVPPPDYEVYLIAGDEDDPTFLFGPF